MKKILLLITLSLLLSTAVLAANEIEQYADRLNYWDAELHTVYVTNNGTLPTQVDITIPTGFTYNSGSCTNPTASTIQCNLASGQTLNYIVQSNSSFAEYSLTTFSLTTNNSYTGNDIKFLRIKNKEIFHTLVEYGRGRGNYFFDSYGEDLAGSGHSGTGCSYLPNGTMYELNFLHKILNIQQYYNLANSDATDATFTCTYPDNTIVRQHLVDSISQSSGKWIANYGISDISGSWERMGYMGMDFDAGEFTTGQNISINCTDINYVFADAHGEIIVPEDSFSLEIRNRNPFSVTSQTTTGVIGNGTQEVVIAYTITNNEIYDVQNFIGEIQAPEYATFIGTRAELWGVGQQEYRIEKSEFKAGESKTIYLVARFDTTNAPNITAINLSQGVKLKYTTCWEINAYNPQEYIQDLNVTNTVNANMGIPTQIVNLINIITNINNTVNNVHNTVNVINNTVDDIWNLQLYINQSIENLTYRIWTNPFRNLTYYPPTVSQNITFTGGTGGAGGGVACRWNETAHYNNSLSNGNSQTVYGTNWIRTDFNNIYDGVSDLYRTCYRVAPGPATVGSNDLLEVYMCNNYDGSGQPETEPYCTLIDVLDMQEGTYSADKYKWECSDVLGKTLIGSNVTIAFQCPNCAGISDGWKVVTDSQVNSTYTFNSTNDGTAWTTSNYEANVEWDWCVPIDFGYEVWNYNNRTISNILNCSGSCDLSLVYDYFNCSSGASTNMLCNLLYGINVTQNNMYDTINIINNTVNNIDNTVNNINTNTNILINYTSCTENVTTPLCTLINNINITVGDIYNQYTTINNTINNINNTLYIMNQTIFQQFNTTNNYINNVSVDLSNLSVNFNCSNLLTPNNETICNVINNIQTDIGNLNTSVVDILDIVRYINGTRWGNLTASSIYQAIQNQTTTITNNYNNIVNALDRMQEFDEELVFLVTDSFGLQQSAKQDINNGDYVSATEKLKEANDRLNEAAVKLVEVENNNQEKLKLEQKDNFSWVIAATFGLILIAGLIFFLFQRPKQ